MSELDLKGHFSRFLSSDPTRLHVAAHSHHPWPDVTLGAHQQAWLDAARLHDDKWDIVFGKLIPEGQKHIAHRLGLSDASTIAFAPNTHEFVVRLLSTLQTPARVLTTDSEFHSFERQCRRLEEEELLLVERVQARPYSTFADRFCNAAARGGHDLVYLSQVHFDSGYVLPSLREVVEAVPDDRTLIVVDGYHAFMALPVDIGGLAERVFYLAGGYKYAMAGEGVCFMHCPPAYAPRPRNTGWFAGYEGLAASRASRVPYAGDGSRFLGATFDPSGLYRFNAVQRWLRKLNISPHAIHEHVGALQRAFIDALRQGSKRLHVDGILPPVGDVDDRGNFLTFRLDDAARLKDALHDHGVISDHRDDRLRLGFGLYHDRGDIEELHRRLARLV